MYKKLFQEIREAKLLPYLFASILVIISAFLLDASSDSRTALLVFGLVLTFVTIRLIENHLMNKRDIQRFYDVNERIHQTKRDIISGVGEIKEAIMALDIVVGAGNKSTGGILHDIKQTLDYQIVGMLEDQNKKFGKLLDDIYSKANHNLTYFVNKKGKFFTLNSFKEFVFDVKFEPGTTFDKLRFRLYGDNKELDECTWELSTFDENRVEDKQIFDLLRVLLKKRDIGLEAVGRFTVEKLYSVLGVFSILNHDQIYALCVRSTLDFVKPRWEAESKGDVVEASEIAKSLKHGIDKVKEGTITSGYMQSDMSDDNLIKDGDVLVDLDDFSLFHYNSERDKNSLNDNPGRFRKATAEETERFFKIVDTRVEGWKVLLSEVMGNDTVISVDKSNGKDETVSSIAKKNEDGSIEVLGIETVPTEQAEQPEQNEKKSEEVENKAAE